MNTEPLIKTLIIKKKGRKYFDCVISGYKCKLVINDISKDLENDRVVKLHVKDLSERTKYGTALKFEPLEILQDRDAEVLREAAKARKDAEKWLPYAESDVQKGFHSTNAITMAFKLCDNQEHLTDRLKAVNELVEKNQKIHTEEKREQAKEKLEQRIKQQERVSMRVLYPLSMLPPMDTPIRYGKSVLVFHSTGNPFRISEDHPSFEGHHLMGHEGDRGCYCYYEKATDEQIAALEKQEAQTKEAAEKNAAKLEAIKALQTQITEQGEYPDGYHNLDGDRYIDTLNIYGGGSCFVVTSQHIWHVRNNGMDGDNWANNNVATGGAGGIGHRIPLDRAIVQQLQEWESL